MCKHGKRAGIGGEEKVMETIEFSELNRGYGGGRELQKDSPVRSKWMSEYLHSIVRISGYYGNEHKERSFCHFQNLH